MARIIAACLKLASSSSTWFLGKGATRFLTGHALEVGKERTRGAVLNYGEHRCFLAWHLLWGRMATEAGGGGTRSNDSSWRLKRGVHHGIEKAANRLPKSFLVTWPRKTGLSNIAVFSWVKRRDNNFSGFVTKNAFLRGAMLQNCWFLIYFGSITPFLVSLPETWRL